MRFSQLLVEYDRNQTLNNYGEKLLAAASKDQSIDFQGILAQYAEEGQTNFRIVLQRNPEAQQAMINYVMGVIEQADPTKNKGYSQAITRLYCFGQTLLEDIATTLSQYLIKFDKLKRKKKIPAPYNDFMRYKSLDEFMTVVEELPDPDSEVEQQKVGALQVPADVQYKLIYGTFDNAMRITSDCVVIVPENKQAGYWWAKEYPKKGVTNRWCTAWEGDNSRFDYYSRQGPLYIIIPARRNDDNEKYQFHFETKQFMDYQDHQIGNQGIEALTQRFPVLMDVFRKQAIEFNIFPLMTAEYKNAIKEYAVTAAGQLDSMIDQYRDRIAGFGFNSLGDYGITIPEEVKASLMEPIGVYLDQTRQALEAKGGFWDKVRDSLGSERDENKIEVMLNTDTLLKGAMDSSRAGGLVEQLAREPDIAKRIDPSHLQDLILRDPLFRFIMRQVPKLYKDFLEKLETEAKQGLNESTGLTFMGSPCTKDCSGHQAGYKWSLDRNGRTANGHSQSFNNGTNIAADVSKKRKQGGGKLPGYVSQTKDAIRKRAARAFAKTTLGQDTNLQEGDVQEHIVKVKGGYELKSKKTGKNLGKYPTRAGAEKRERQVQYFKHMGEATFNSKQEVIDHFVKQGKSAAAGAAAWERGFRGSKPKTTPKPKPQQPQQRYWWQDKDLDEGQLTELAPGNFFGGGDDGDENIVDLLMSYMEQNYPKAVNRYGVMTVYEVINDRASMGYYRPEEMKDKDLDDLATDVLIALEDDEDDYDDEQGVAEGEVVDFPKSAEVGAQKTVAKKTGNVTPLKVKPKDKTYKKVDGKMTGPTLHSVYEGRVYYSVIGTPEDQLKSEFSMSKDENGWYLKENVDKRKHVNAYRAFGAPKLKEYNLAAFSGDAATKGEDNVVSPLTKSIKKK